MILEALVKRYESQAKEGKLPRQGWGKAKVSFALRLNAEGRLVAVVEQRIPGGKKKQLVPREMEVPEQAKRTSGIVPQFLCENSSYFLGIDNKGKPERSKACFAAAKELHRRVLGNCPSKAAQAVLKFFLAWEPDKAAQCAALRDDLEEIKGGANLVFMLDDRMVLEDEAVRAAWSQFRSMQPGSVVMQCLVTGQKAPIARLHPSIKGVRNAQSSGASLVSFNAPAYESYGHDGEQGLNAPVSEYAAFAYGTALNDLLSDTRHVQVLGDTTVVYWAEEHSAVYQDFLDELLFQGEDTMTAEMLDSYMTHIRELRPFDYAGMRMNYANQFYVLGLAPNAARLSVRFFLRASFGEVLQNVAGYLEDVRLVQPFYRKTRHIPLWALLRSTVSPKKSKDKAASPLMSGAVLRSILTGTNYPASLFQNVMLRIKAEQDEADSTPPQFKITYERVAAVKAYLIRNMHRKKENLVALNDDITDAAYVLGRIFAVWENIQESANEGINTTIKDRYFDSMCATPARIFPILQKLSSHHLRKLEIRKKIYFEKNLAHLMGKLSGNSRLPAVLPLEEQGMFILGYYHQVQDRYRSKEEKENG